MYVSQGLQLLQSMNPKQEISSYPASKQDMVFPIVSGVEPSVASCISMVVIFVYLGQELVMVHVTSESLKLFPFCSWIVKGETYQALADSLTSFAAVFNHGYIDEIFYQESAKSEVIAQHHLQWSKLLKPASIPSCGEVIAIVGGASGNFSSSIPEPGGLVDIDSFAVEASMELEWHNVYATARS